MRIRPAYIPADAMWPFRGLDVESPSNAGHPNSATAAVNVDFLRGFLAKRPGYSRLGSNVPDGNPVMMVAGFSPLAGGAQTVISTTRKQYLYTELTGAWSDITPVVTGTTAVYTGGLAEGIHAVAGTDVNGRWLIATNGADPVRRWNGTGRFSVMAVDGIVGFQTCRSLAVYGSSLFLGNVTSAGSEPQTVYWSDTINFTNFATGNSGAQLLPDLRGQILRLQVLGDRLAVYSEDSIAVGVFVGGAVVFSFETLVHDTRLLSGLSVVDLGLVHLFAGREGIFAFDGTRRLIPVAETIRRAFRDALALDRAAETFAFHDTNENRVAFAVPGAGGVTTVFMYEYDRGNPLQGQWTTRRMGHAPRSMGYFVRGAGVTYNDLVGTLDEWAGDYLELTDRAAFPLVATGTDGKVMLSLGSTFSDDGLTVDSVWEGRDLTVPGDWPSVRGRWFQIEIEARGDTMQVSYSADRGRTWSTPETLTLTADPTVQRVWLDVVSPTLRVRLAQSGVGTFVVLAVRCGVRDAGVT